MCIAWVHSTDSTRAMSVSSGHHRVGNVCSSGLFWLHRIYELKAQTKLNASLSKLFYDQDIAAKVLQLGSRL